MSIQLKKCRLCGGSHNILNRECYLCGFPNEQFFDMPEISRDAFIEFYHDREIYTTMETQAIKESMSVESLYKKAAEYYLDSLVVRKKTKNGWG